MAYDINGYPIPDLEPPADTRPECEFCGEQSSTFYYRDGECVGCDNCVYDEDAETVDYVCPVCGEECETIYMGDDEILGCEKCIKEKEEE